MLILSRARLVNWHFFLDDIIEFGPMTLLAGDNGSGKSTIIDALQYAFVLNIGKIRFNAAAFDNRASRNLHGYCRCKIGSDTLAYLRESCITHVMLEFRDGERRFCAGVMVEAFADSETREYPWILEDGAIEDVKIYYNREFLSAGPFRDGVKETGGTVCSTKREYNSRLTHLLRVHRRNIHFNPYLEALVRSVNFTPFTSVNDFVCTYILEERQVDISAMRENLANYKEAEREAREMEGKITALEKIAEVNAECESLAKQVLFQEYFILRLDVEKSGGEEKRLKEEIARCGREITRAEEAVEHGETRKRNLEQMRQELSFALATNEQYRLFERIRGELEKLRGDLERERKRAEQFALLVKRCGELLGRPVGKDIRAETKKVDKEREETAEQRAALKIAADEKKKLAGELRSELRDVKRGILRYPESTLKLKEALEKAGISAVIFADQLEVSDTDWQNAVEGWLDSRRFDILVPEDEFQEAFQLYTDLPKEIAGTGIPRLARMRESDLAHGSLAEVVEAASPLARRYAAYLLGDVVRAELNNLLHFENAVTKECMRYAFKTVSRIEEEVYSRWYIGKQAKEKRLAELERRGKELTAEIEKIAGDIRGLDERSEVLMGAYGNLHECITLSDAPAAVKRAEGEIEELDARLNDIDTGSFDQIKLQLGGLNESLKQVDEELTETNRRLGGLQNKKKELAVQRETALAEERRYRAVLDGFCSDHEEYGEELEAYYRERMKGERTKIDYEGLKQRYGSSIKGIRTKREKQLAGLQEMKSNFNYSYSVYLTTAYESDEFTVTLKRYRETELPAYKEKIGHAREEAEKQFREHFVSRLNEYITDAKESFREINYTLSTIRFGQDQYRFGLEERQDKKQVLDVIRNASEIKQWEGTLFDHLASEEEKESIERLFRSILENDLDSEEVRQICDYREYFQYDIRIKHTETLDEKGKPLESSLTKVLREKSGGETQTPYYVAIAASFFRFYKDEPGAVRLVLFDEAFNKMDDERIGKMIAFFKKLNMQIVTAVPTEKIEAVAPYMDITNLILRKDYSAFVRKYEVIPEEML
jgi:uncharacterized protein YPO0396